MGFSMGNWNRAGALVRGRGGMVCARCDVHFSSKRSHFLMQLYRYARGEDAGYCISELVWMDWKFFES